MKNSDEGVFTHELVKAFGWSRSEIQFSVFIRMIATTVTVFNQGRVLIEDDVDHVLADQRVRDVYLGKQAA